MSDAIDGKDLGSTGLQMQENDPPSKIARKTSNDAAIEEVIKKAEEEKNFKGLKDDLLKIHKQKRKEEVKKKVTGEKMLKLLKLDNFNKYENEFLTDSTPSPTKSSSKSKEEKQGDDGRSEVERDEKA